MDINILGHRKIHELPPETCAGKHVERRNHVFLENPLFVINIVKKKIQSRDSLNQPCFNRCPFPGWNNSRDRVKRKDPFGSLRIAIDIESHALTHKRNIHGPTFQFEFFLTQFFEGLNELAIMLPCFALFGQHFIEKPLTLIMISYHLMAKSQTE